MSRHCFAPRIIFARRRDAGIHRIEQLSTAFLYGWDAERGIKLAVDEINAAGGVKVGNVKRPFKVEVIDTRDLEPGVPVSEALLGLEKLILEKKADFIVGGPVRSEAALAAMDLLSRYKRVSILTTGVLTPAYQKRVADNYNKYKYCFRNTSHVGVMMPEFVTLLKTKEGIRSRRRHHGPGRRDARAGGAAGKALKGKDGRSSPKTIPRTTNYSVGLSMPARKMPRSSS